MAERSKISEKVYLITGAASGLGRQLAADLAARGRRLALFDRNSEQLEESVALCAQAGGEAIGVVGDVTVPADCSRFIEAAIARFGRIDALVNNAGISMWARFEDITDVSIFTRLVEVNYLGAVYCTHYALPHIKKTKGSLVAISSIQGRIPVPFHTGYVASKHAVQGFFSCLRSELRGSGVHVLLVLPHWLTGTNLRANAYDKDGRARAAAKSRHSSESVTVEACSKAIIESLDKRREELVIPAKLRALPWLNLISPRLVDYLVGRKVEDQRK